MAAKDYLGHDPSSPDSTVESSFDKEREIGMASRKQMCKANEKGEK